MSLLMLCCVVALGQVPASQSASLPQEQESGGEGNKLKATPNDIHAVVFLQPEDFRETSRSGDSRILTSRVVEMAFPFNDLLPSWNVDVPDGAWFAVEIKVGRQGEDLWSQAYYLGSWPQRPQPLPRDQRHVKDANGYINIDYFSSTQAFDRAVCLFWLTPNAQGELPRIRRVALACSNTLDDAELAGRYRRAIDPGPKERWARRLPVPFRSQKWEDPKIRGSICSPTSVSMVLEYRGRNHPTAEVCRRIWDPEYRLYGNWWRAVQGAYSYGVPGYLRRFGDWDAVKCHIAHGQPIIASIKVRRGQLRNAPYRQSNGHLIVITGLTESGDVCVNDPAAETAEAGQAVYAREDMEKVWLANGGVGYILEAPDGVGGNPICLPSYQDQGRAAADASWQPTNRK